MHTGNRPPSAAAFFDVDETLITVKSMLSFLAFRYADDERPAEDLDRDLKLLAEIAASEGRAKSNTAYYSLLAGASVETTADQGRRWFARELSTGVLFHPPVLRELADHRQAGRMTVLVSGAFLAVLDPVAEYVGADAVLGTVPEAAGGRYTGRVSVSRIGPGKALGAAELMDRHGLDPAACHAYGDHASDADLLVLVGHPVMVGEDPELLVRLDPTVLRRLPGLTRVADRQPPEPISRPSYASPASPASPRHVPAA